MRKMKTNIIKTCAGVALLAMTVGGCTNLDESVYSEIKDENFYKNKREIIQAALRPFIHMQAWLAPTGGTVITIMQS